MKIDFISVNNENRERALGLHVAENQAGTVETVKECLKEADELPLWRPIIIAEGDEWIGFAMYGLWIYEGEHGRVWLDRFFIVERYQGIGYASRILPLLIEHISKEYGYDRLYLSVYKDNHPAIHLYKNLGFSFNGEHDINGEKVMVLTVS